MDAIDAALVDFTAAGITIVAASATRFDPALKIRIAALIEAPERAGLDEVGQVDVLLAESFARAAQTLLSSAGIAATEVDAIGSHGQTIRHRVDAPVPFTLQIGDPNTIAERTGITVVGDFRRRDVAAGGQGAPLVPAFHDQVFRSGSEDRVILNLGGIANVTILRKGHPVIGFDTGPANRLLDAWIGQHRPLDYDDDGRWAQTGTVDGDLLERLMSEAYLGLPAPKSTGRELFNLSWLATYLGTVERRPEDVQATLLEYTAASVALAIAAHAPGASIYVCGGGAHNRGLLAALRRRVVPSNVATTDALGLPPDYVEAVAFAWFAKRTLAGDTSSVASVTGARGARVLGGIFR